MMNGSSLMWGVVFGAIGAGYLVYGKKQRHPVALVVGVGLCAFPYFVSNPFLVVLIGVGLMALPYFLRG